MPKITLFITKEDFERLVDNTINYGDHWALMELLELGEPYENLRGKVAAEFITAWNVKLI